MVSLYSIPRYREARLFHTTWVTLSPTKLVTGLVYITHSKVAVLLPAIPSTTLLMRPLLRTVVQPVAIAAQLQVSILFVRCARLMKGFDDDLCSLDNYMDYSDDSCMNQFTPGQVVRLKAQMSTYRGV
jgi:hypothetical protein